MPQHALAVHLNAPPPAPSEISILPTAADPPAGVTVLIPSVARWRPVPQAARRPVPQRPSITSGSEPVWPALTVLSSIPSDCANHFSPGATPDDAIKALFPTGIPRQRARFDRFTEGEQLRALALAALSQRKPLTLVTLRLDPDETVKRIAKSWKQHRRRAGIAAPLSYFGVTVYAPHKHAHLLMPVAMKGTSEGEADYDFLCRLARTGRAPLWGRIGEEDGRVKVNLSRVRYDGKRVTGLPGVLDYLDGNIATGTGDHPTLVPELHASQDLHRLAVAIASGKDIATLRGAQPEPESTRAERIIALFRSGPHAENVAREIERIVRRKAKLPMPDGRWRVPTLTEAQRMVLGDWMRLHLPLELRAVA